MARHAAALADATVGAWWAAAWRRTIWTMLWAAIAVAPGASYTHEALVAALVTIGLAGVAALLTAAIALPEATGARTPAWWAITARTVRTAAQVALASGIATATTLGEVDWATLGQTVATASVLALLKGLATLLGPVPSLPETAP